MAHGFYPLSHSNTEVVLAADFNRAGTRLATGSADHRIRVFELVDGSSSSEEEDEDDKWELVEEWRAHNAQVTDVRFDVHSLTSSFVTQSLVPPLPSSHS